jgi:hypothetical protein
MRRTPITDTIKIEPIIPLGYMTREESVIHNVRIPDYSQTDAPFVIQDDFKEQIPSQDDFKENMPSQDDLIGQTTIPSQDDFKEHSKTIQDDFMGNTPIQDDFMGNTPIQDDFMGNTPIQDDFIAHSTIQDHFIDDITSHRDDFQKWQSGVKTSKKK